MTLKEVAEVLETALALGETVHKQRYVRLQGVEIMDDGLLRAAVAFGPTVRQAKKELAHHLCGQRVVKGAMTPNRREIKLPKRVTP